MFYDNKLITKVLIILFTYCRITLKMYCARLYVPVKIREIFL